MFRPGPSSLQVCHFKLPVQGGLRDFSTPGKPAPSLHLRPPQRSPSTRSVNLLRIHVAGARRGKAPETSETQAVDSHRMVAHDNGPRVSGAHPAALGGSRDYYPGFSGETCAGKADLLAEPLSSYSRSHQPQGKGTWNGLETWPRERQ